MNIVFLMDALETIAIKKDTTYVLMKACQEKGYSVFFMPQGGCQLSVSGLHFACEQVRVTGDESAPFEHIQSIVLDEQSVEAVFIRKDPPFDERYLTDMWLLEQCSNSVKLFNDPLGIRTVNEKIWAMQFKDIIPDTVISSRYSTIKAFIRQHEQVILKPTNGYGGKGIFKVSETDENLSAILELLTNYERDYIVVQAYIEAANEGDKRILLLNGEPIGAVLRLHGDDDHRNNFFAGGKALKADLDSNDEAIIARLKPSLLKLGLAFVGIDVIGGKLIEVNVTSPTCVQEINALNNTCLETIIINQLL